MKPMVEPVKSYQWGADDHRTRVDVMRRYNEDKARRVWDVYSRGLERERIRRELHRKYLAAALIVLVLTTLTWFFLVLG